VRRKIPLAEGETARTACVRVLVRSGVEEKTGELLPPAVVAQRVRWCADLIATMTTGLLTARWNAPDVARLTSGVDAGEQPLPSSAWMALRRLGDPRFAPVRWWWSEEGGEVRGEAVDDAVHGRVGDAEECRELLHREVRAVGQDQQQDPVGEPGRPAAAGIGAGVPELLEEPLDLPAGAARPCARVNGCAAGGPWTHGRSLLF
jgi:hypothetical protein